MRIIQLLLAMLIALSSALAAPGFACASDDAAVGITPEDATNTTVVEHESQEIGDVLVSANLDAALIDGLSYGFSDFMRSQAGSNKAINGQYFGYNYYLGTQPETAAVISTGTYAVCYIPSSIQDSFGIDIADASDEAMIKEYFVALDDVNAKGSSRLSQIVEWHFTSDPAYEVDGVMFNFDQQIVDGRYYAYVIGADGQDATSQSHPSHVKLDFADFARIVPADEVDIVKPKTGIDWLVDFLANIDYSPLWVTLKTTGTAIVFIFILGLAAAYFTMRIPARVKDIFDSIFTIPMVLPPTVCGFLLLLAFGNSTALGRWFNEIGFPLVFSWPATVIAAVIVAFPLMYRSARGAFESLDPNMLDAARTLGWSNARIFFKLMLPLAWSSIAAGTVLAFARALGEFGATLFLAGNYAGITRTIPIAIYFEWMNSNTDVAIFWTIVIMAFSFIVILFINIWSNHQTKYRKRSIAASEEEGE